jgi:hypothetical protein
MKSDDLLLCVVRMRRRGYSWDDIQNITGVGIVVARRTYFCFRRYGLLRMPTRRPRKQRSDKIFNADALAYLDVDVRYDNELYLDERAERCFQEKLQHVGKIPSRMTLSRALRVLAHLWLQ